LSGTEADADGRAPPSGHYRAYFAEYYLTESRPATSTAGRGSPPASPERVHVVFFEHMVR
jgi:hypothetical protein